MDTISRREFLRVSTLAAAGVIATACAKTTAPEPTAPPQVAATATPVPKAEATETPQPVEQASDKESPLLANLVQAGALPPLQERLPGNPQIVPVVEEIGQYGGIWHRVGVGMGEAWIIEARLGYECPVRWTDDGKGTLPNLMESLEINGDATEYTFHMRAGHKWSDGAPYTADDFVFWYEDNLLNADLTPTFPLWLSDPTDKEPVVVSKMDDHTVQFTFKNSYGLFNQVLAGPDGLDMSGRWPQHWLKQFHPGYAKKEDLDKEMAARNFENWWQLFGDRRSWQSGERPGIYPWMPTVVPPTLPVVCSHNAYYHKTDPEGNQLPYLDEVQFDLVENADLLNMKAVAGEIDMQLRHIQWTNYPLFIENAEKGDYRVVRWTLAEGSNCLLMPNHNHKDPGMREVMQNKDFRIALSHALNRAQINELAYMGLGTPRQASLVPQCGYFKPEHATKWVEYDPDKANQILDEIGMAKGADGFRTKLNGEPLKIVIEYAPIFGPWKDVVEMVCKQFGEIGIQAEPKEEDRTLLDERSAANECDMRVWTQDRCFTPLVQPEWFMIGGAANSSANLWNAWWTSGGTEGEEPPADVKAHLDLYAQIKAASPDKLEPLAQKFFDEASDYLAFIGTVGVLPHVGVVKNKFRNVPDDAISDWLQLTPGNTYVEQYFWRQA